MRPKLRNQHLHLARLAGGVVFDGETPLSAIDQQARRFNGLAVWLQCSRPLVAAPKKNNFFEWPCVKISHQAGMGSSGEKIDSVLRLLTSAFFYYS
jgi:hypothetical protein